MNVKKLLSILLFLVIMGATVFVVLRNQDLTEVLHTVAAMNKIYLGLAIAMAIFFVGAEGLLFLHMFRSLGEKAGFLQCIKYAFVGFFYSGITPSASGGQPMQLYYMNRDGHSFVHSTIALVCAAMAYKLILVLMGIGIALFWWQGLKSNMGNLMPLYFLGLALNSVLVLSLLLLLAFGAKIEKIILVPERFLIKIHLLKDSPKRREKLHEMVLQYADTVVYLRTHVKVILNILAVTFVQRCAVFGLTYFVYRGMGLSGTGAIPIMALQAVVYITVDMLPLPGSQGVTELVYAAIFGAVFTGGTLTISMCVTRGINYYLPLIISAIVAGYCSLKKKRETAQI